MTQTLHSPARQAVRRALHWVALTGIAAGLAGCGGGSAEDPISVDRLVLGQLSTFTVTGTNLTSGVRFTTTGCDGMLTLASGSATQQQFTCTPNAALAVRVGVFANGAEFYRKVFEVPVSQGKVDASVPMTVDRLSYGRTSVFTIQGSALDTGIVLGVNGCDKLVVLADSNASQRRFSCTPTSALQVGVALNNGAAVVFESTLVVPAPQVTLTTSLGTVVVQLDPAKVKLTVDNFLAYVNSSFYNGTLFHRVIGNFVVQGGGFTGKSGGTLVPKDGLRASIALETNKGLSNLRGSIAMARTNAPNSATAQFYFNAVDNTFLDYSSAASPGYAVFGQVLSGQPVLDAIGNLPTTTVGNFPDVPVTDVFIVSASQTQ